MENYLPYRISKKITKFIMSSPLKAFLLGLAFFLVAAPGLMHFGADFSYRIWFQEGDPHLVKFDAFERQFGNDDNLAILVESPNGVFDKETIELVHSLTRDLWQAPEVIRVDSLTNHNYTTSIGDEILVDPFIPEDTELTPEYLSKRAEVALNDEVIPRYLVNEAKDIAMIYARLRPALDQPHNYKFIMDSVRQIIQKYEGQGDHKFHITGNAAINVTFEEVSRQDMQVMLPLILGFIVLFLIIHFRGVAGVFLPFFVILLSIMGTFGMAGWAGLKFNPVISIIPSVLIAICIADVVHILVSFFQFRKLGHNQRDAVEATLDKNIVPTFLTSLSTSIGFWSLAPTKIVPVASLGILSGFGTMLAWVFTIFVIGPFLIWIPIKKKKFAVIATDENKNLKAHPFFLRYAEFLKKFKVPIVTVFAFLGIGSIYLSSQNVVNSDPFEYFTSEVPLKSANDLMEERVGAAMAFEMVFDSGMPDGIKAPEFLNKVDEFEKWAKEKWYVTKVISVTDILKGMNRTLNASNQEFYVIPQAKDTVAQQLFLYTMSLPQGMDLNNRMTLDNSMIRVTMMAKIHDSKSVLEEIDIMEEKAKSLGLNGHITGKNPLYQKMNNYVVDTYFTSIFWALILVSILMCLVFQSWKLGLLSMIPNTFPIIAGGAILYLLKKPIDMGTVMVTSVCLGIAVDDTIHFLANFRKYRKSGKSPEESVAMTLTYTGAALLTTSMILVVAFGAFMFASFIPNINFGIMTAVVLSTALFTDVTLLPALLVGGKDRS